MLEDPSAGPLAAVLIKSNYVPVFATDMPPHHQKVTFFFWALAKTKLIVQK